MTLYPGGSLLTFNSSYALSYFVPSLLIDLAISHRGTYSSSDSGTGDGPIAELMSRKSCCSQD